MWHEAGPTGLPLTCRGAGRKLSQEEFAMRLRRGRAPAAIPSRIALDTATAPQLSSCTVRVIRTALSCG